MSNVSLKVWNTYCLKNIDMYIFVEMYTLDLLENLSLKIDVITYCLKIHGNTWIKNLKLTLLSYNGPYLKHGGHVSNLKKHSPWGK
jgi:hypothetical protein